MVRAAGVEPATFASETSWIMYSFVLSITRVGLFDATEGGAFFELIGALNAEPGLLGTLASRRCRHPYAMPARECWRRHERDILRGRRPIC